MTRHKRLDHRSKRGNVCRLRKVTDQRRKHLGLEFVLLRQVLRMIAANFHLRAALERQGHLRSQFEAQEMHSGALLAIFPLKVLVGDRIDARLPFDFDEHAPLDSLQPGQCTLTLGNALVLDQHGGFEVRAVRDHRFVRL